MLRFVSKQLLNVSTRRMIQPSRNVVSGPPATPMPFGEKLVHMGIMTIGILAYPAYVLVNIKHYRGVAEEE